MIAGAPTVKCHKHINRLGPEGPRPSQKTAIGGCYKYSDTPVLNSVITVKGNSKVKLATNGCYSHSDTVV